MSDDQLIGNNAETVIGPSMVIEGNFTSENNIRVDGTIKGELKTKSDVTIGEGGKCEANMEARNALVAGGVKGDVTVSEKLTIAESGRIEGNISSKVLEIAAGAYFAGQSEMAENGGSKNSMIAEDEEVNEDEDDSALPVEEE